MRVFVGAWLAPLAASVRGTISQIPGSSRNNLSRPGRDRALFCSAGFQPTSYLECGGLAAAFPSSGGALAQLNLARAYALQAGYVAPGFSPASSAPGAEDKLKARTAYQDFLALWKDADPDIPVLRAAKSEYAKLK